MALLSVSKRRRLVNPGRKRKLSPLQKLFFGSKRQRAAVSRRKRNIGEDNRKIRRSTKRHGSRSAKTKSYIRRSAIRGYERWKRQHNPKRRRRNISAVVSAYPKYLKSNPGRRRRRKKAGVVRRVVRAIKGNTSRRRRRRSNPRKVVIVNMARRRRVNRSYRRRKRNVVYKGKLGQRSGVYKYTSNPGRRRRRRSTTRSYRRRRNPGMYRRRRSVGRRHHSRRRNPDFLNGTAGKVVGVIGGLAITKFLTGFVPAQFNSGIFGYLTTGIIAVAQGKLVGKLTHKPSLGNDLMVGGLAYLAARLLNDFFPSIGGYTGISGMGLIGGSSFYVPQVNTPGNMGRFVTPGAIGGAIAAAAPANTGIGRLRRTGRLM